MAFAIAVQFLLPLGLVAGLAFAPIRSMIEMVVRVVATAAVVAALALVAVWTVLPGSLPWLYGVLGLFGVGARVRSSTRRPSSTGRPVESALGSALSLAITALYSTLGALGLALAAMALQGRKLPPVDSVDIPLPFEEGLFLVVNGGARELINAHMKTLDESVPRFRAFRGQSYGLDLVRIDRWGLRAVGLQPSDPADYAIFGNPVYSPCEGTVVSARGDRPDMPVPQVDLEVFEGNHVLIRCGDFDLLLAHFQNGTVQVSRGERVHPGQLLGRVANSGRTGEPHLHCSAQRPGTEAEPFSGEPLSLTINGQFAVRNQRLGASPR